MSDENPFVIDEAIERIIKETIDYSKLLVPNGEVDKEVLEERRKEREKLRQRTDTDPTDWLRCPDCGVAPEHEEWYYYGVIYECQECQRRIDIAVL